MTQILIPPSMLAAFLLASLVLAITPGPGVIYIVTRSATQGRAAGLASVAGVATGNLGNAVIASLGLAAVFAISSMAFDFVKYAGAGYLVYLGVRALRRPAQVAAVTGTPAAASLRRIFLDGALVALFNPKTTLFFAAFLPQFLAPGAGPATTMALAALFVLIAACTDTLYVLASSSVVRWFAPSGGVREVGRYLGGATFIGLGLLAAFAGRGGRQ